MCGVSQSALLSCTDIIQKFPAGLINLALLHPLKKRFEWTDIPSVVKTLAEMRIYGLDKEEDAYEIYGIDKEDGVIAVIRPDGYVGTLAPLSAPEVVETYFQGCLVRV